LGIAMGTTVGDRVQSALGIISKQLERRTI
jgi:hypothetical protein